METTRLSSKGQITLPKAVRDLHRWEPGTDFIVEDTGDGVLLRPIKKGRVTRLEDVAGCLKYDGPARTVEEMNAAIEAEVCARHAHDRY
ncbi:AbrB/MazE/SpoVT family DNA-binding domain-containing protein [Acidisphaera sp. S103]|uniref:AbrB/MazE/SpoVT family DNA-binding domain-containing protein n=1 Tax=Acidisphaera sp. S103 TaxID=1747223 RepID=UPI00131AAB46|nr:AbrB/MazE/SpoVT family DNA-binding domain-containing protein [Acidisphaera sp. S103]